MSTIKAAREVSVVLSALLLLSAHALGQPAQAVVGNILEKYQSSLSKMSVYAVEGECKASARTSAGREGTTLARFRHFRDGDSIDVRRDVFDVDAQGEPSARPRDYSRAVINREDEGIIYYGHERVPESIIYTTKGHTESGYARAQMGGGEALEGYFASDQVQITDLMKEALSIDLQPDIEKVDGFDCYVVDVVTKDHGSYKLYIDPEHGYLPRRVEVRKSGDDIWDHTPLSDIAWMSDVDCVIEIAQIEEIDGTFVPTSFRVKEIWRNGDTIVQTVEMDHEITGIDFHPDFETLGAFEVDLPDGIKVNHQDFVTSGLGFEWRDGKVVAAMNEVDLRAMDDMVEQIRVEDQKEPDTPPAAETEPPLSAQDMSPQVSQRPSVSEPQSRFITGLIVVGVLVLAVVGSIFLVYRLRRGG